MRLHHPALNRVIDVPDGSAAVLVLSGWKPGDPPRPRRRRDTDDDTPDESLSD